MFRPSRPDFIETSAAPSTTPQPYRLFRPSRPDFIETIPKDFDVVIHFEDCSGLLGRTSLRHFCQQPDARLMRELFRPSRPDFIETLVWLAAVFGGELDCSGLLGRTSLRRGNRVCLGVVSGHCSGLLGRTSLRRWFFRSPAALAAGLFRPSRPDFIETQCGCEHRREHSPYCSGLLGRTSLRLVGTSKNRFGFKNIVPAF